MKTNNPTYDASLAGVLAIVDNPMAFLQSYKEQGLQNLRSGRNFMLALLGICILITVINALFIIILCMDFSFQKYALFGGINAVFVLVFLLRAKKLDKKRAHLGMFYRRFASIGDSGLNDMLSEASFGVHSSLEMVKQLVLLFFTWPVLMLGVLGIFNRLRDLIKNSTYIKEFRAKNEQDLICFGAFEDFVAHTKFRVYAESCDFMYAYLADVSRNQKKLLEVMRGNEHLKEEFELGLMTITRLNDAKKDLEDLSSKVHSLMDSLTAKFKESYYLHERLELERQDAQRTIEISRNQYQLLGQVAPEKVVVYGEKTKTKLESIKASFQKSFASLEFFKEKTTHAYANEPKETLLKVLTSYVSDTYVALATA